METNDETNNANEHNVAKNLNWREADQLAIYKRGRGVELGSTEKQLQLSGQSGTWNRDLRISSPAPIATWPRCPLGGSVKWVLVFELIVHFPEQMQ